MLALEGLDPRQFIIADQPFTPVSQLLSLVIQPIDVVIFRIELLIPLGGQPVSDLVRFQIGLFLRDARRGGPKSAGQCLAS